MDRTESLSRLAGAETGHLATMRADGRPHIVVVVFALVGERVVTAIDQKPKTTTRLQRLINIETNPAVSFLVDDYSTDWSNLWWVRVDGQASIHVDGQVANDAQAALVSKYPQYRHQSPEGPFISIESDGISSWTSTP